MDQLRQTRARLGALMVDDDEYMDGIHTIADL